MHTIPKAEMDYSCISVYILFAFLLWNACAVSKGQIIVNTTDGKIRGIRVNETGHDVIQFRKVPYAKAPIGALRFQKPQPPESRAQILDATEYGPACIQPSMKKYMNILPNLDTSEDCLYMNIYVPYLINRTDLKTVMVYIHGGGYYSKTANLYDGSKLAIFGDVVVVLINYRLGMFGFLSTEDDNAQGNYGLWDQIQALRWIKNNIENFGGDPNRVTIFGHSAGGYSIGLLLLSAHAKGLFQRAILMSGFGISSRAITHEALNTTVRIGKYLGCGLSTTSAKTPNTTLLIECFKNKTAREIRVATSRMRSVDAKHPQFIMRPGPVIDGEFLTDHPVKLIKYPDSVFYSVDVMAGTSYSDGWLLRSTFGRLETKLNFSLNHGVPTRAMCGEILPVLSSDYYHSNKDFVDSVCKFYSAVSSDIEQGQNIVNMYGDMMYASPAVKTLRMHKKLGNSHTSYHFLFSHKPSFPVYTPRVTWLKGAQHGDECWFIFRNSQFNYTDEELNLNVDFIEYLTNFAKQGNPNGNSTIQTWPEYNAETEFYMDLNMTPIVRQHLFQDRVTFWLNEIPSVVETKNHVNTSPSIHIDGATSRYTCICLIVATISILYLLV